jgi:hypothetical protein
MLRFRYCTRVHSLNFKELEAKYVPVPALHRENRDVTLTHAANILGKNQTHKSKFSMNYPTFVCTEAELSHRNVPFAVALILDVLFFFLGAILRNSFTTPQRRRNVVAPMVDCGAVVMMVVVIAVMVVSHRRHGTAAAP